MIKKTPFVRRGNVAGRLVAIMDLKLDNRELELISPISRVIKVGEIHEIVTTEEQSTKVCNKVGYIGFFEVMRGGVLEVGDTILIKERTVGEILGFNNAHMPNHMNIVIKVKKRATGVKLNLKLDDSVLIKGRRKRS